MKKLFLSAAFVALALVASAQVTPEKKTTETSHIEESMSVERLSNRSEEMTGRRVIMIDELPLAVQAAFGENKEFKEWKVQDVLEVEATSTEPLQYELVLIPEDIQDEVSDAQDEMLENAEELAEEGAPLQSTTVMVRVPAVVLRYDAEGRLVSQVKRPVDEPEQNQDQGIYRQD